MFSNPGYSLGVASLPKCQLRGGEAAPFNMASNLTDKQPAPTASESPAVWPLVITDIAYLNSPSWLRNLVAEDMRARDAFGRAKYGTPLLVDNGRDAAVDAYQEVLDLCAYARQQAERTHSAFWASLAGTAVGWAAAIRYQLALEEEARKSSR